MGAQGGVQEASMRNVAGLWCGYLSLSHSCGLYPQVYAELELFECFALFITAAFDGEAFSVNLHDIDEQYCLIRLRMEPRQYCESLHSVP